MNIPIKFRGCDLATGEFVYGYFMTEACGLPVIFTTLPATKYEIYPDSITRLVGYDKVGNEVYEGDTVIRYDDEEEFIECPENGKLCTVIFDTQVIPNLNDYYCLLKEN